MKLTDYLQKHDIKYPEFARRIGTREETVFRYLQGKRIPDRAVMPRILAATNGEVTANDFYDYPHHLNGNSGQGE